eukprot:scaffold27937_cov73-Cyclotella_meneghiniana.AAC.3
MNASSCDSDVVIAVDQYINASPFYFYSLLFCRLCYPKAPAATVEISCTLILGPVGHCGRVSLVEVVKHRQSAIGHRRRYRFK